MNRLIESSLGLALVPLLLVTAQPALASLTITGRYTFITGDTATRVSYFTGRRIRVQSPDDQEVMYDSKTGFVTVIDHGRRLYWEGPVALADSIVDGMTRNHWAIFGATATEEQKAGWVSTVESVNDNLAIRKGPGQKRIAGYPCDQWTIESPPYLHLERWVARSLVVPHYDQETYKVATGAVLDPIGRAMMGMFWQTRAVDGLPLGATMTFGTGDQLRSFTWEAVKVDGGPVPESAWAVPAGYAKVDLPGLLREDTDVARAAKNSDERGVASSK